MRKRTPQLRLVVDNQHVRPIPSRRRTVGATANTGSFELKARTLAQVKPWLFRELDIMITKMLASAALPEGA